jgi:hypothetical protein
MKRMKPSIVIASAAVVGIAIVASGFVEQTGSRMATAAGRFMGALGKDQAARALFPYDSAERLNWHFIPRDRKGVSIKELTPEQRALAFGLIATGTGGGGYIKATTIMSLEQILLEMEKGSGPARDPERYFLTIFGTPSDKGKWGWRVEGHHLSLNFALEDGWPTARTRPCGSCRHSTATRRRPPSSPPRLPATSGRRTPRSLRSTPPRASPTTI